MNLLSVASTKDPAELKILEKLDQEIPRMNKEDVLLWLWNAVDDLERAEEHMVYGSPAGIPIIPNDWGFELDDVANYLETHNQYALIYVLTHRLLFCNGELEKLSA